MPVDWKLYPADWEEISRREMIREIYRAVADGKFPMSAIVGHVRLARASGGRYPKNNRPYMVEELTDRDVERLYRNVRNWIAAMATSGEEKEK